MYFDFPAQLSINRDAQTTCDFLAAEMNKYIVPAIGPLVNNLTFVCTNASSYNETTQYAQVCSSIPAFSTEDAKKISLILDVNPTGPDFANSVWNFIFAELSANLSVSAVCSYNFFSVYGCLPSTFMSTPPCSPESPNYPFCECDRRQANTPFGISDAVTTEYNISLPGRKALANKYCFTLDAPTVPTNTNARNKCARVTTLLKLEIYASYAKRWSVFKTTANGVTAKTAWGNPYFNGTINFDTYKLTQLNYPVDQVQAGNTELCIWLNVDTPLNEFCVQDAGQFGTCVVSLHDPAQECCPVFQVNQVDSTSLSD